jgi:hypothetical protein
MTKKQIAHILDSGRTYFGIRRTKVYVDGVFKNKYKYLETIEFLTKNEEEAHLICFHLNGTLNPKNIRGKKWFRVRVTGTRAAAICKEYGNLLDKKKKKAQVLLELAKDKEARVHAPFAKQEFREDLKEKMRLC